MYIPSCLEQSKQQNKHDPAEVPPAALQFHLFPFHALPDRSAALSLAGITAIALVPSSRLSISKKVHFIRRFLTCSLARAAARWQSRTLTLVADIHLDLYLRLEMLLPP